MTPSEFANEMHRLIEAARIARPGSEFEAPSNEAEAHPAMDALMCKVLRELGYGAGVDLYEAAERWYDL